MDGFNGFRVFVSAVSSEFGAARSLVASDLRARGLEVKVQEDFRQEAGADTTLDKLADYIVDCSALVCVIGRRSGSIPPPSATDTASDDKTVRVWNPDTGQTIHTLTGHTSGVTAVAVALDGSIGTASYDRPVRVWNPDTGVGVAVWFARARHERRRTFERVDLRWWCCRAVLLRVHEG